MKHGYHQRNGLNEHGKRRDMNYLVTAVWWAVVNRVFSCSIFVRFAS